MKVKCINENTGWHFIKKYVFGIKKRVYQAGPNKGDIVTVERFFWSSGEKYYVFIEWPRMGGYNSKHFIPLEEIFEKVSVEKIKEQPCVN